MKTGFRGKRWGLLGLALFAMPVLFGLGPVLRESDQASLLDGALQIARGGDLVGPSYYNYGRQYGSYWILAAVLRIGGQEEADLPADRLVRTGNVAAALVFLLGLGLALWLRGPQSWPEWLPWLAFLSSPVALFSAPLLASNTLSAGVLFGLAVVAGCPAGMWGTTGALVLSFLAVALRADAVLVLPVVALMSAPVLSVGALLRDRRVLAIALGAILALGVGGAVHGGEFALPRRFFETLTFGAYLLFGLCGAVVLWAVWVGSLAWRACRERSFWTLALALALLVPIAFYGTLLYTPRHLLTTALVLVLPVMFPRGREAWALALRGGRGRLVGALAVVASLGPLVLGLGLHDLRRGGLVLERPTLFPSSDGFWPMGANLWFSRRLAHASEDPVDHNQRVWDAWKRVSAEELPDGSLTVNSSGLRSLGNLRLTMLGRQGSTLEEEVESPLLMDGRSVLKAKVGVGGTVYGDAEYSRFTGAGRVVGEGPFTRIFLVEPGVAQGDEAWEVLQALRGAAEGNDFLVARPGAATRFPEQRGPFRWLSVEPKGPAGEWQVVDRGVSDEAPDPGRAGTEESAWLARSALPAFMSVNRYRNP